MKRWARVTLKILGGFLLGVVTLAAAWAAFNNRLVDDAPRPVPEALRVPATTLPQERNAFFALIGLTAAGDDPQAEGVKRWAAIDAGAINLPEPAAPRRWPTATALGPILAAWQCDAQTKDCVAVWTREATSLRALVDAHVDMGSRCEAVARPGMVLEEPLITPRDQLKTVNDSYVRRASMGMSWQGVVNCQRWLEIRAALAGQAGDKAAMLGFARQGEALSGAMLSGARTLIGVGVSGAMARMHWRTVTDLAARYPAAGQDLRAMLRPLPAQALDASVWIRSESQFGREAVKEDTCVDEGVHSGAASSTQPLRCKPAFWLMPHATRHLMDAQWLEVQAKASTGLLDLIDWQPDPASKWVLSVPWRNSIGGMLVSVSAPMYPHYFRKQASLMLLNEAARMALAAGNVEPSKRSAWLARQPMDARLRERLSVDGDEIVARVWATVSEQDTLRYRIPPGATSAAPVTGSTLDPSPSKS
ncbi:hypothetical protein [Mitsuaria sp. 7]|uniref:hypothetical protein n=1 Tax=Mitsuaria sp. 7 TaxID=1658665 RepID=UPI0007DCFB6A|nr:hypothetical protein [Mitsuaria sp. 7]ANH69060.1 hypothetical protein ABE85_18475 [Mitsuaria sp. 7]